MKSIHIVSWSILFCWIQLFAERVSAQEDVVTTSAHRLWVTNRDVNQDGELGEWVEAELLELGDRFRLSDGSEAVLTSTEPIYSHVESYSANASIEPSTFNVQPHYHTTYNFEVGSTHNYFVSEAGVWVHNDCDVDGKIPGQQGGDYYDPAAHRMRSKLKKRGVDPKKIQLAKGFAFADEATLHQERLPPISYGHIFFGEQSIDTGNPIGFHSEGGRKSLLKMGHEVDKSRIPYINPDMPINYDHPKKVYEAYIRLRSGDTYVARGHPQTFFPRDMNHIDVLKAVWSAWVNWTFDDNRSWRMGISYKEQLPVVMRYKYNSLTVPSPIIRTAAPVWTLQVIRVNNGLYQIVDRPLGS